MSFAKKDMKTKPQRILLLAVALGALLFATYFIFAGVISKNSFYRAAIGEPTSDITVAAHQSRITDNLFRSSSYWHLKHNAENLDKWLTTIKPDIDTDYPEGQIRDIAKAFQEDCDPEDVESVLILGQVDGREHTLVVMKGHKESFYKIGTQ